MAIFIDHLLQTTKDSQPIYSGCMGTSMTGDTPECARVFAVGTLDGSRKLLSQPAQLDLIILMRQDEDAHITDP